MGQREDAKGECRAGEQRPRPEFGCRPRRATCAREGARARDVRQLGQRQEQCERRDDRIERSRRRAAEPAVAGDASGHRSDPVQRTWDGRERRHAARIIDRQPELREPGAGGHKDGRGEQAETDSTFAPPAFDDIHDHLLGRRPARVVPRMGDAAASTLRVVRMLLDGAALAFTPGDTIADAMIRAGQAPAGCLCLAGDCPYCLVTIDGVSYLRACQTPAAGGLVAARQPVTTPPAVIVDGRTRRPSSRHEHCGTLVIGAGPAGRAAARAGDVLVDDGPIPDPPDGVDTRPGMHVIGIYPGPRVVALGPHGTVQFHPQRIVIATGSSDEQLVATGLPRGGVFTLGAARRLLDRTAFPAGSVVIAAGTREACAFAQRLPDARIVIDPRLAEPPVAGALRGRVAGVSEGVVQIEEGPDSSSWTSCDILVVGLGRQPRDLLVRMAAGAGVAVEAVGSCGRPAPLPPPPGDGLVCPCAGVTTADLVSAYQRGFHHVELLKRSTTACTGTCQGAACLPHVRAFIAGREGTSPPPITARPAARQLTIAEAAAGAYLAPIRRTALHDEHVSLGARLDRFGGWWRPWSYGDPLAEYWAVREGVSICDVSTLGKVEVVGPEATEFLERLYPCHVADLEPGRARYALLLDEAGYTLDDGLIVRDRQSYFLTFTTGGASAAEAWLRDWADASVLDVRMLDRTSALGAINVTGPLAATLLERLGVTDPPGYMRMADARAAGIDCRVIRLGFTGEASYELHHDADRSVELWRALLAAGSDLGVRPHGLDALLTLRLEKGHVIVGQDTDFDSTPRRLHHDWAVKFDKPEFVGRHALVRTAANAPDRELVGVVFPASAEAPDEGAVLTVGDVFAGYLTSCRHSPALGRPVALGWLEYRDGALPQQVLCGGAIGEIVRPPFYDPDGGRVRV